MSKENPLSANERLREERLKRGWSQQKLADQLGIAVVTVNRWERGKQQPTGYYRLKLTTLFEKSAAELGLGEELSESSSLISNEETRESEHERATEQAKEAFPSYYENISEKPLLERETTRRFLSFSAQFGTPLLRRRGRTVLLFVALILFVIIAPITFVRIHSTGAKTLTKPTPSTSSAISFAPPSKWTLKTDDPMTATHHDTQWNIDETCTFHTDGYYATSQGTNYCNYGESSVNNFSDLAYSIDILFYKGTMGGLIFRLVDNNYYGFYITTTGKYCILWHTDNDGGNDTFRVAPQSSSAIIKGLQQKNTLSILARGPVLQFWINGQMVKTLNDTTYKRGTIAVFTGDPTNDSQSITAALFKNAKVWTP